MNPQRKRMIISEIKYWKQNKLLPAHYCDFLITLYAKGRGSEGSESHRVDFCQGKKEIESDNCYAFHTSDNC